MTYIVSVRVEHGTFEGQRLLTNHAFLVRSFFDPGKKIWCPRLGPDGRWGTVIDTRSTRNVENKRWLNSSLETPAISTSY